MFTVMVNDDESTFGPAPQLREAFQLLDELGALTLHTLLNVSASWAVTGSPDDPEVTLELAFHEPVAGSTAIRLGARRYAAFWRFIVGGGLIGITTAERLRRRTASSTPNFADAMEASIVVGVSAAPELQSLIDTYGW